LACVTLSFPEGYLKKIDELKRILGIRSSSEIVRRGIDELARRYGVEIVSEGMNEK